VKVAILGMDGYIGWPLAMYLSKQGHEVSGIDNFSRRFKVMEVGGYSAIPIASMDDRLDKWNEEGYIPISFVEDNITCYDALEDFIKQYKPEAIVHLAEQPSAPYSMISRHNALSTIRNNVDGTMNLLYAMKEHVPSAHLVKLGTMGEYGTPNIDIPEGFLEIAFNGRTDKLPFPRQAGSFYHWSKVTDSQHISFACKIWDLRSTDIMQGVVYGTRTEEMTHPYLNTRFDFDETFGTVINRYCAQAVIGYPLTVYGYGRQKRGFIALPDSLRCLELAIENPPNLGEYRVFNQISQTYDVTELAELVKDAAYHVHGGVIHIKAEDNPRIESEDHYYNVIHEKLPALGFVPKHDVFHTAANMIDDLTHYTQAIRNNQDVIKPRTQWR